MRSKLPCKLISLAGPSSLFALKTVCLRPFSRFILAWSSLNRFRPSSMYFSLFFFFWNNQLSSLCQQVGPLYPFSLLAANNLLQSTGHYTIYTKGFIALLSLSLSLSSLAPECVVWYMSGLTTACSD